MIEKIIELESIEILMQPVVSPNKDLTAGVEALVRGINPDTSEKISPRDLFKMAVDNDEIIPLEKLIIKKALEAFKALYLEDKSLLLFINLSDDFLTYAKHSFYITSVVDALELPYENIVFDLHVLENDMLDVAKEFVENYRSKGFFICMDDIGHNYYNIDKIMYLLPDIIKVNMIKVKKMEVIAYRDLFLNNLVQVSNTMGMIGVAKGVETIEDLQVAMQYGVQFIQGYFVSRPIEANLDSINVAIENFQAANSFQEVKAPVPETSRMMTSRVLRMLTSLKGQVETLDYSGVEELINQVFDEHPCIENVWFVDEFGSLIEDSLINEGHYSVNKSPIYQIYKSGADFSTKEHYSMLQGSFMDSWVTKPYKSILTNNICFGGAIKVDIKDQSLILCVNVNYEIIRDTVAE